MLAASTPPISPGKDEALLASRAHELVSKGGDACTQCVEFATAYNSARADAGYWRAVHSKALEREKGLKQTILEPARLLCQVDGRR